MTAPTSYDEYIKRFSQNTKIDGYGFDVTTHVPCPFCAAPDFQQYGIMTAAEDMQKDAKCGECGRSAKAIVTTTDGGSRIEVVQTGGPDAPSWLPPIRRVS